MNIGLIDVDGHHFPNLALMKLSAWHKLQGDAVSWYSGIEHYDKVYMSKVFTFTPDDGRVIQADEVVRGGTGYNIASKLPIEIDRIMTPVFPLSDAQIQYSVFLPWMHSKLSILYSQKKRGKDYPGFPYGTEPRRETH